MKRISRRELIKIGILAAGLSPLSGIFSKASKEEVALADETQIKWIPSCCNMCGGQTGIMVQVIDGRVVKIEPNNENPNGFSNNAEDFFNNKQEGAVMCPKGNSGIMALYDPDRVKKPLLRTNKEKGINVDPKFKEISWDEAYEIIVERLKALKDNKEEHKLIWFSEDHSFTHIQSDFCELFGTPNYSMHSNLCDVSRKASFKILLGHDRPLCDFINTKYILLFGWNPLSATKWAHLPRIITRAIENGAKMVVVDPNFSLTASKAHEWIPIIPSTDGALALAMANVIIAKKLYDKEFVKKWVDGFDEFAKYVSDKTPRWASKITSVPIKTIERLAIEFATTKPAIVDCWSGPGQHSNAVYGGWAIGALAAITGQIDSPGTLTIPVKKGNSHQHIEAEKSNMPRLDGGPDKYPFYHKSGVYTEYFNNIAEEKGPYMPKVAFFVFQNVMMSVPGTKTVEAALKKIEFIVCIDTHLSETAMMADLVIPGSCYLERYDWNSHWVLWPVLGLRQPAVKPIFGQPTEYEFIIELGKRLGIKDKKGVEFFSISPLTGEKIDNPTKWYEDYLSKEVINGAPKMSLEEIKRLPGATWVAKEGTKYHKYAEEIPQETLKDKIIENNIVYTSKDGKKDKAIGIIIDGKAYVGFETPTRKVQLYAEYLKEKKDAKGNPLEPLPVYKERDWMPDKEYPYFLINWKEASHTHTRTHNNPYLMELKGENHLRINTISAKKLGINNGDKVIVESPFGKMEAIAEITEGIHPKVVGLQHGFGHWALGNIAKGKGSSDAILRPTESDPISGMALHKQTCVKIYKA